MIKSRNPTSSKELPMIILGGSPMEQNSEGEEYGCSNRNVLLEELTNKSCSATNITKDYFAD